MRGRTRREGKGRKEKGKRREHENRKEPTQIDCILDGYL
jgi:hypothetical protein